MGGRASDQSAPRPLAPETHRPYVIRISRLTIDKLGVKLYDKVSAAVAELIANSYDADAEKVVVRLPLSTALATKGENKNPVDAGYVIEIEDNGYGMTPDEAIDYYLQVGRNRREHEKQGSRSREKGRPVMGRKGIGKLAPFGICKRIEVVSAGGPKTDSGYLVTHFLMDYDGIVQDTDEPVPLERGELDRTYKADRGTIVRLSQFLPKRVPDEETFHRQLAIRFVFARPDFKIVVEDVRDPEAHPPKEISLFSVPVVEETRVDLSERPITTEDEQELRVTGWLAMAKEAYKNEEMTGVRIYARDKIVATTRDFEQPAGYTGEYTMRSYLVGEVVAEWLDLDEGDDLIRTDRQGILWDSDYGRALRVWGAELIKEIGKKSRKPRREKTSRIFVDKSRIEERAGARFKDKDVVKAAVELGKQIGAFAAEDELDDEFYVNDLSDVILAVAPHKALIQAFQDFSKLAVGKDVSLDDMLSLFGKTRVAEMASYGQIAAERVKAIRELEKIVLKDTDEDKFQRLLARAPWLIEPTWSVITKNQALKTFKAAFEAYWKQQTGEDVTLAIGYEKKRPDFTLVSVGHMLHVVEIKASGHTFNDEDLKRLIAYVYAFRNFFGENQQFKREFPDGWRITLVADAVDLKELPNKESYERFLDSREVERISWKDFLTRAKVAHEQFLEISDKLEEYSSALAGDS